MTVMQAIQARRSVREYQSAPIEKEKLEAVLNAGRLAPSARNQQDWRFVVVQSDALRAQMVGACASQAFVGQAPAILVVCAGQARIMACGQPAQTVDASIALSFMMLEAAAQGLGTCWLGSFSADKVKELLGLPQEDMVVAVTPLGYPASMPAARPRKALDEVVEYK